MSTSTRHARWWFALCALVLWCAVVGAQSLTASSLRQAIELVQRETPGRILSAETVRSGKNKFYRIKVLGRDGRIRIVQIAAVER
jgi:uncharacterized membrane protein YkoI